MRTSCHSGILNRTAVINYLKWCKLQGARSRVFGDNYRASCTMHPAPNDFATFIKLFS